MKVDNRKDYVGIYFESIEEGNYLKGKSKEFSQRTELLGYSKKGHIIATITEDEKGNIVWMHINEIKNE